MVIYPPLGTNFVLVWIRIDVRFFSPVGICYAPNCGYGELSRWSNHKILRPNVDLGSILRSRLYRPPVAHATASTLSRSSNQFPASVHELRSPPRIRWAAQ